MAIANYSYTLIFSDKAAILAIPNHFDKNLKNSKSYMRAQYETFNSPIWIFECLQNTFYHGFNKYKMAFDAICIIIQYQMDGGA